MFLNFEGIQRRGGEHKGEQGEFMFALCINISKSISFFFFYFTFQNMKITSALSLVTLFSIQQLVVFGLEGIKIDSNKKR